LSLAAIRERLAARRAQLRGLHTVVLCGGGSSEREVSLKSGAKIQQALSSGGYRASFLPVAEDGLSLDRQLAGKNGNEAQALVPATGTHSPERNSSVEQLREAGMVITTMHGRGGEDGAWQGLLELMGVPFVSAGVKGSALAFDKLSTKRLASFFEIATPRYCVMRRGQRLEDSLSPSAERLIAKPVNEGSSVGIELLVNDAGGWNRIAELARLHDPLLVEEYIAGQEITCGVIGHPHEALTLPLIEIRPSGEFYDFDAKYVTGETKYICPAPITDDVSAAVAETSLLLYRELELSPYSRFDYIVDSNGKSWFLEANTLPGFTEYSLLPMAAKHAGIEFAELIEILMLLALERWEDSR
jgi:D-alanine-D-alanine ligase